MKSAVRRFIENTSLRTIDDYIVPGMRSCLLQRMNNSGCLRAFITTRHQMLPITPHSHRYDLTSTVLEGAVDNIIWEIEDKRDTGRADPFEVMVQKYNELGDYETKSICRAAYWPKQNTYKPGDSYFMSHEQIHSIWMAKGTVLLIEESPQKCDNSWVLFPIAANHKPINILKTEDWMFYGAQH